MVLAIYVVALIGMPILAVLCSTIGLPAIGLGLICAIAWGIYVFMTRLNIEYEYQLTASGREVELDIAKIINGKKRKEVFQGDCKEFEIVAKLDGQKDCDAYRNSPNRFEYVRSMEEPDVYFIVTNTEKGRSVIYIQLDEKMLDHLKKCIPSKVFEY